MTLAIRDRMRLQLAADLRGSYWQRNGTIRYVLGDTPTALSLRVTELLTDSAAWEAEPALCGRLVRLRAARKAARAG